MKFSLITIYVKDLKTSEDFYCKTMNMEKIHSIETPNGSISFLGEKDGVQLELIHENNNPQKQYEGFSIGFNVENINESLKRIQSEGYKILSGPMAVGGGTQLAFFQGPNGEKIELIQPGI